MFNAKKALVVGMAKSGIATAKYLLKNGIEVLLSDSKDREKLLDVIEVFRDFDSVSFILGQNPSIEDIEDVDFAVVSPAVALDLDFLVNLRESGKEVFSEIELAYRVAELKNIEFLGITGTNGKTTTTSIVGEILKHAGKECYVVGNIGSPAITAVDSADKGAVMVTELSSFQLEGIVNFAPRVSSVLNLTEDHMNRHHTMEKYAEAKMNIFKNQSLRDICVLNYDDDITRAMADSCGAEVLYFSRKNVLDKGVYVDDGYIVYSDGYERKKVMNINDLSLPGGHNLENSMAAMAMCIRYGVDIDLIVEVLKTFKAVEHRLEYVDTIDGVIYVNDSKGTNPDSTIKAVQSYKHPIILIAGGYDKGSDFNELFKIAKNYVRSVIILGQTGDLIEATAHEHGLNDTYRVESITEAVYKSREIANESDVVLLSPACASWGMYNNYEERGEDFKQAVRGLKQR